jgi:hypothetical protein
MVAAALTLNALAAVAQAACMHSDCSEPAAIVLRRVAELMGIQANVKRVEPVHGACRLYPSAGCQGFPPLQWQRLHAAVGAGETLSHLCLLFLCFPPEAC